MPHKPAAPPALPSLSNHPLSAPFCSVPAVSRISLPISGRTVSNSLGRLITPSTYCCKVCKGELLAGALNPYRHNSNSLVPQTP